ncbi:MAG TPA: MFS transporter [Steroidobacteraceae bacterium]|nr:MFS transporter [Steroidobacteraceae bacterium]
MHSYRWVIVAAGALLGCVAVGSMFSLPVFLAPMSLATGWSRTGISLAMTIGFLAMAFGSLCWGTIADRTGPRPVVFTGSVLIVASLLLAGRSQSLHQFQLVFGLLMGFGASAIFVPMIAAVTGWFETRRSLAVSLVSAGMGIAPMTMSPIAGWLIAHHDWHTAFFDLALIAAATLLPTCLLVRRPPALQAGPAATPVAGGPQPELTVGAAVRSPQFIILLLTNFCCCATHSGPIFHTVSYAIACGIAPLTAVSIYSVEGLAGLGGRIGFGLLGDRFGAKHVLVTGLFIQACAALGYYFTGTLSEFYAVAALFGFTYAGTMPLYSVIIRENFPLRMMGTIIGGTTMAGSLGMASGPVLGGWIYDTTGSYSGLYLASFGMGLGASLIALTFRPFSRSLPAASAATP